MKKMLVATAAAILLAGPAYAVDVENQDQQDYSVSLDVEPGYYIEFKLAAGQTRHDACPDNCRVSVDGVGWVSLSTPEDKVIIKDGKLHLAPRS